MCALPKLLCALLSAALSPNSRAIFNRCNVNGLSWTWNKFGLQNTCTTSRAIDYNLTKSHSPFYPTQCCTPRINSYPEMAHLLMIFDGLCKTTKKIVCIAEIPASSTLSSSIGYFSHELKVFSIQPSKNNNVKTSETNCKEKWS